MSSNHSPHTDRQTFTAPRGDPVATLLLYTLVRNSKIIAPPVELQHAGDQCWYINFGIPAVHSITQYGSDVELTFWALLLVPLDYPSVLQYTEQISCLAHIYYRILTKLITLA